jgi:hypothetical protein
MGRSSAGIQFQSKLYEISENIGSREKLIEMEKSRAKIENRN